MYETVTCKQAYAVEYGYVEAVLIHFFYTWIKTNRAATGKRHPNGRNYHDGRTWSYNTIGSLVTLFPCFSTSGIRRAVAHLIKANVLMTGNYNKASYDRTLWYAFVDEKLFIDTYGTICRSEQMDLSEATNGTVQDDNTIPVRYQLDTSKDKDTVRSKKTKVDPLAHFEDWFWIPYNYNRNPEGSKRLWKKLSLSDRQEIRDAVPPYVAVTYTDGTFPSRMHPTTYIGRDRRWEDQLPTKPQPHEKDRRSASERAAQLTFKELAETGRKAVEILMGERDPFEDSPVGSRDDPEPVYGRWTQHDARPRCLVGGDAD